MDVEVYPLIGDPLRLTGDRPEEGVSAGKLDYDRSQQVIELIEAAAATTEDYGNERHGLNFAIVRVHESAGHASQYYLRHASKVPAKGRVKFTSLDALGNLVGVTWLEDAIICAKQAGWETCETTFIYQITGGAMTSSE